MDSLHDLTSRHALLAIGFCLMFFGVVLRGLARTQQRELDYRRQHELHHRRVADANAETAHRASAFEKHFPKIANLVVILGLVAVAVSFTRD
jgi:hypothetical protein